MRYLICLLATFALFMPVVAQVTAPKEFTPSDVWVVVNRNSIPSIALGEFYCQQRKVPMEQLIKLDLPETEEMSRKDYEDKLLTPLREKLKSQQQKDFILLTTYGVPIRVAEAQTKPEDQSKLEIIKKELKRVQDELLSLAQTMKKLEDAGEKAKAGLYNPDVARLSKLKQNLEAQESNFGSRKAMQLSIANWR
jgi:uncharacterized protein (TIGR03790 family)